ncbi:MAG: hypothetical protein JNM06_18945, partial [Blastocatellia bacterium]|nr:hypothetical protein [Blastocatellia bacterium]
HKRDFYTPLLPFDLTPLENHQEPNFAKEREVLLTIFINRLKIFLAKENNLSTHIPLLKILPSLNKAMLGQKPIKFTEEQAAELLKELGAIVESNPSYLGRSRYRVNFSKNFISQLEK